MLVSSHVCQYFWPTNPSSFASLTSCTMTQLTQSHTVMEAMETIGCASKGTETWQQCKANLAHVVADAR